MDGCRNGWLVIRGVFLPDSKVFIKEDVLILTNVKEVFPLSADIYAFDMPIGLLENYVPGGRTCDRMARKLLGPRRASIFSPPPRKAFLANSYQELKKLGLKLSLQSFNLLPKIKELDEYLRLYKPLNVYETHPELVFWSEAQKTIPSKHSTEGFAKRKMLLEKSHLFRSLSFNLSQIRASLRKDLLDAYACLLAAKKIYLKEARVIPEEAEKDTFGLKMQIWF
nr:DUF429 domain-containing protein [Thermodesulfatator autotrophicus]